MRTQIQPSDTCPNFYTLTTAKGKQVQVGLSLGKVCSCSVYIQRNGRSGLSMGRHFWADTAQEAVLKAIDAYKAADVKAALRSLLSSLI